MNKLFRCKTWARTIFICTCFHTNALEKFAILSLFLSIPVFTSSLFPLDFSLIFIPFYTPVSWWCSSLFVSPSFSHNFKTHTWVPTWTAYQPKGNQRYVATFSGYFFLWKPTTSKQAKRASKNLNQSLMTLAFLFIFEWTTFLPGKRQHLKTLQEPDIK